MINSNIEIIKNKKTIKRMLTMESLVVYLILSNLLIFLFTNLVKKPFSNLIKNLKFKVLSKLVIIILSILVLIYYLRKVVTKNIPANSVLCGKIRKI